MKTPFVRALCFLFLLLAGAVLFAAEFRDVGSMRILRCTIMSPWFDISRGGRPDYVQSFCASLERAVEEALAETDPSATRR